MGDERCNQCHCHSKWRELHGLFLVNLDLVQQQQELIFAKDKQIRDIVLERNNLQCRLERMERRLAVLRHKTDSESDRCHTTPRKWDAAAVASEKRKAEQTTPPAVKKMGISGHRPLNESEAVDSPSPVKKEVNKCVMGDLGEGEVAGLPKSAAVNQMKGENVQRTACMYYVMPLAEDEEILDLPVKKPEEPDVSVPTFRINPIATGYSMEGTENLDDEIFVKRHQKPEQEEKRRKRWDVQRLRDQSLYERLQLGRNGTAASLHSDGQGSESNSAIATFSPDPEEVRFIEVHESIPVAAFGYPLPCLSKGDFNVSWFNADERDRAKKVQSSTARSKKK